MSRVIAVKNADGIEPRDLETFQYVRIMHAKGEIVISAKRTPDPTGAILDVVEKYFSAIAIAPD